MAEITDEKNSTVVAENGNSRRRKAVVLILLLALASGFGGRLWLRSKTHVETDNAFVEGHLYTISSRVAGQVARVPVQDNQPVQAGDTLLELDTADYQTQLHVASAQLGVARDETAADQARCASARASVNLAQARLEQAELDLKRGEALLAREVIPREQVDRLRTAQRVAAAQLIESQEELRRAVALAGSRGQEARVAQRRAQLDQARLNLNYTVLRAPANGYITKKSVEQGNNIAAGQPVMALVALDEPWIIANYKESQLSHVRPGQRVEFTVDAYPGRIFSGRVDSIMAGTGAAFSLLPPENATGNYVKVVQRIPVKITIDRGSDPEHQLRVGMSVVPTILVERSIPTILKELLPF